MKTAIKKAIKKITRHFRKPLDIRSSWVREPAKFESMVDFLNWFQTTSSIAETVQKAKEDWNLRITRFPGFQTLNKETCLEIGFGGGRLLVPASRCFQKVIGVDIHAAFAKTRQFLESQDVSNYRLINEDELEELKENSLDFIYSFIVFQHFDSFAEVDYYLKYIKRVLKPGGFSHIFFGKCRKKGVNIIQPKDFEKSDRSLFIEPEYFRRYLQERGFILVDFEDLMQKRLDEPLSPTNEAGQARVLFTK